jgi:hypothetical protein
LAATVESVDVGRRAKIAGNLILMLDLGSEGTRVDAISCLTHEHRFLPEFLLLRRERLEEG